MRSEAGKAASSVSLSVGRAAMAAGGTVAGVAEPGVAEIGAFRSGIVKVQSRWPGAGCGWTRAIVRVPPPPTLDR